MGAALFIMAGFQRNILSEAEVSIKQREWIQQVTNKGKRRRTEDNTKIDVEYEELIRDSSAAPKGIIEFHIFNDLFGFF